MSGAVMVCGTMSGVGKSFLVAAFCRILRQDGFISCPFKSQNMALNSCVTADGLEMGRAQAMQAEAAGREPDVRMNPILLKPTGDRTSQVILNGKPYKDMDARSYFSFRSSLLPTIKQAYDALKCSSDYMIIEGAGSPAEINLKEGDIVNMGLAEALDVPVLLVGDIDRGGVFAQLYGTYMLLDEQEKKRIVGFIINKFRGDVSLLEPGLKMLEDKCGVPVLGVIPYAHIDLEDEDSLSDRFEKRKQKDIDLAVIRLPHISNFTDFNVFEQFSGVSVRYITDAGELSGASMVILPGTKNTMADLDWLKETGLAEAVREWAAKELPILGICGGFQMLGESVTEDGETKMGLSLLPVRTVMTERKTTKRFAGSIGELTGIFAGLAEKWVEGYEIHMGETGMTEHVNSCSCKYVLNDGGGVVSFSVGNVWGTYVHGVFDRADVAAELVRALAARGGVDVESLELVVDYSVYKDREYDRLAGLVRGAVDMEAVYRILGRS